jgi:pimeloyl-ACP methyl ester carboxylesterase
MMAQTLWLELNAGRFYVETAEAAARAPVIFLHGNTLDRRMWDAQWAPLAARHRVIRYDLRGFGRSTLPTGPYAHTDDLLALLDAWQWPVAHLIGLSKGGGIALDFAVEHPERVASIVTVGATLTGYGPWEKTAVERWQHQAATARKVNVSAARELWLQDALFEPANRQPAVAAHLRQMVEDYSGWHWLNRNPERVPDPPTASRLATLTMPILASVGEYDLSDFQAIAHRIAECAPRAQSIVFAGVGHLPNMENPAQFNQAILDFLAKAA